MALNRRERDVVILTLGVIIGCLMCAYVARSAHASNYSYSGLPNNNPPPFLSPFTTSNERDTEHMCVEVQPGREVCMKVHYLENDDGEQCAIATVDGSRTPLTLSCKHVEELP
jgi:hypothetical protein